MPYPEALAEVLAAAAGLGTLPTAGKVSLADAGGRVLGGAICAERDQPSFSRSTRDGFAVRTADLAEVIVGRVVGVLRAGVGGRGPELRPGEAL